VLLLSATRDDPGLMAWRAALMSAGIPFDACVTAAGHRPITYGMLAERDHARYQAVIVVTGGLPCQVASRYVSSLRADEWAALADFERRFAIRRVTGFVYPSAQYGLGAPAAAGSVCGVAGALTAAGRRVFGELREMVSLDPEAYGYRAKPLSAAFETLVRGPDGSALVGVFTDPDDGRENIVCTVSANEHTIHMQLLSYGMLRWVTRGVHLGHRRYHLSVQVDDVFLADDSWDRATCTTVSTKIRMGPDDVVAAVAWSRQHDLRLRMAFNAYGADDGDDLTASLLHHKEVFDWVNHTFAHRALDEVDLPTLISEICGNLEFAHAHGLSLDPAELVTGEHSGLRNPQMPHALSRTGIRWIADDNSRRPVQRRIGSALTVPRHPTNMYFNVATCADQLHEYDHRLASSTDAHGVTLLTRGTTWGEFVSGEADTMLLHVLGNDPRPHFVHQSNLSGDRIAYKLLHEVVARFRGHFNVELTQLSLAQAGEELALQAAWRQALGAGGVSAYVHDGRLHVRSDEALRVPITGTQEVGSECGSSRSGWSQAVEAEHGDVVFTVA
jgi:hypothetical protein